jgi:hypothetical protein
MDDSFVSSLGANAPLQLKDAYLLFYVREKGDALSQAVGSGGVKSKLKNPFVPPPPPPEEEEGQDESEAEEEEGKEESENAEAGPSRARATPTSTPAVANGTGKKRRRSDIAFAPEETEALPHPPSPASPKPLLLNPSASTTTNPRTQPPLPSSFPRPNDPVHQQPIHPPYPQKTTTSLPLPPLPHVNTPCRLLNSQRRPRRRLGNWRGRRC